MKIEQLQSYLNKTGSILILVSLFTIGAWFSHKYSYTFDLTRDNRNSLTEISKSVLQSLDAPVDITILVRNSASERQKFKRAIAKYQKYKKDVALYFLDSDLEVAEANEINLYNPGQIRIDYKNHFETVDKASEQNISNALQRLSRSKTSWIAFLNGHGERDPFSEDNQGYSTLKQTIEATGVQIQTLNLLETTLIPDNISVLIIASPQTELLAGEEKLILNYVQHGGNILWLIDPKNDSDTPIPLQVLAHELGLTFHVGTIIDANQQLRSILGIQHPAVVPVVEYEAHAVTENLSNQSLFPFATGLILETNEDWQARPLYYSLARAWSETGPMSAKNASFNRAEGDVEGPLLIAAAFTRTQQSKQQRIVVIGDSDFLANAYVGHGANLTLAANILQWLADEEETLSFIPYQPPDISIQFNNTQIALIASTYLLIVPLLLLVTGIFIGIRRHRAAI